MIDVLLENQMITQENKNSTGAAGAAGTAGTENSGDVDGLGK